MCENDALAFTPHIGMASGQVTVGYVGTPIKYNCSVFGAAVAMAARCAAVKASPGDEDKGRMVFPAEEWGNKIFEEIFPPTTYRGPSDRTTRLPPPWQLRLARKVEMKNLGDREVREVVKTTVHVPYDYSAEQRAKETLEDIRKAGRYWPRSIAEETR
jgi:hypothetical protein